MKINRLVEGKECKSLSESEVETVNENEETLADINPSEDSVADIADALQAEVETASEGEETISDQNALKAAAEIKDTAKDIGAIGVALNPESADIRQWDTLGVKNELTNLLDFAYNAHMRNPKANTNVLVTGLPGSGKTSIVKDWAHNHSPEIHIYEINVGDPELEKSIFGLDLRDLSGDNANKNKLTKSYGEFLDQLDVPNTVLFLDELNRGQKHIRRALLDLVLDRESPDIRKPGGKRFFKNLLFTVACQNPSGMKTDAGAQELSDPEKTRFQLKYKGSFDSTPARTLEFFTKYYDKQIKILNDKYKNNKADQAYLNKLEELLKMRYLMRFIANDPKFEYLDGVKDVDKINALVDKQQTLLTQRGLTGIADLTPQWKEDFGISTYGQAFIDCFENTENFRPEDAEMLHTILSNYTEPSFEALLKNYGIKDVDTTIANKIDDEKNNTVETTIDQEDDDVIFGNTGIAPTAGVGNSNASSARIDMELNDILDSFNI